MRSTFCLWIGVAFGAVSCALSSAMACPFCSAPTLTLSEQVAQSDAAVLAQWIEASRSDDSDPGRTVFEARQVLRSPEGKLKAGDRIIVPQHRAGKASDLVLLTGTAGDGIQWGNPVDVTETSFQYIAQAPPPDAPRGKRLEYFMGFLEFPDSTVANDAYAEFANAPYQDIAPLATKMPRDKLRAWVASRNTPSTRLGLYGLMLGLCGNKEDAHLMEAKITEKTEEFRLGIDGLTGGYLLLTGQQGLDVIDQTKLKNRDIPFSETYAAMQALRFMWQYEPGRIPKERLRQSMRILLDRPELADLVIADLARWKDWSIVDLLVELYSTEEFSVPAVKRAIIRYLLVCSKDMPEKEDAAPPEHVQKARRHLATLREKDPKSVKEAERFFFLQ